MTMKETKNRTSFDSRSFGKETDTMTGSKDRYELNDSRMDANLTELESEVTEDCSNFEGTNDSSMDNEKGTMDSPKKAGQILSHHLSIDSGNGTVDSPSKECKDGLLQHLSISDKDADSLSSDSSDTDKEQRSPEHENLDRVEEFVDFNGSNSKNPSSLLFTDKNVLEAYCKEIDSQFSKDIRVDEGRPLKDASMIKSYRDEIPGSSFPQPPNDTDHFEANEDSSLDTGRSTGDQCVSKNLISQERLGSCLENTIKKDTVEHCEPENAVQTVTGKAETDTPEEDFLVHRKLPVEDLGPQNSLGLDGGNTVMPLPDQVLNQEAVPDSPAALSPEAGSTGKDVQASCLQYNSEDENRSITFNFTSPEGVAVGNSVAEDVEAQSTDSRDVQTNSIDITTDQSPSNKNPSPTNDVQSTEPVPQHHDVKATEDVPVVSQLQHDMGETSFSAASTVAYSGPIAFSGSLSHRSDASTTSGKSFAFPTLQSEWNSSPVRMAEADRRQFRKHKGWRSGVLCCRF